METSYYLLDNTPCILTMEEFRLTARGYFAGQGLRPVSVTAVRWQGEPISEREYQARVASMIIAARKLPS